MINNLIGQNGVTASPPLITFTKLTLQNFGLYQGRHTIDLQCTPEQPIVLIKGMNGSGKTTILDAIRLVLYGSQATPSTRGKLSYAKFLRQCINSQANGETTLIELTFSRQVANGKEVEILVRRTWHSGDKYDDLEIYKKGKFDSVLTESWEEQIEELLPVAISNLFLFDGEQIQEIVGKNQLPSSIIKAIRSLLDLDILDQEMHRLAMLMRRSNVIAATPKELETLVQLEEGLKLLKLEQKQAEVMLADAKLELEVAQERLEIAQANFVTQGGRVASQITQHHFDLEAQQNNCADTRNQLQQLAAEVLPITLIGSLLQRVQSQYRVEAEHQVNRGTLLKYIQRRNVRLLEFMVSIDDGEPEYQESLHRIHEFLRLEEQGLAKPVQADIYLNATPSAMKEVNVALCDLPDALQQTRLQVAILDNFQSQVETVERLIAVSASPEQYEELRSQLQEASDAIADAVFRHEVKSRNLEKIRAEIIRIEQSLVDFSVVKELSQSADRFIQSAEVAKKTLQSFGKRLVVSKISRLEKLVAECLLDLLHKPDLIRRVKINPDTFEISLYDAHGTYIPRHRLSAGEKQLLANAMLWGLARASSKCFPVVIDTPLSRLDHEHREKLVQNYFPKASHQVIILSTDTEIKEAQINQLRSLGAIALEHSLETN
jgi:DNA sulfur modification protein DndD